MDMMLLKGCERGSSVNSRVFFLRKSVFLHYNFKKTLRGNSERIPTTIVAPHKYECSLKGELNLMSITQCLVECSIAPKPIITILFSATECALGNVQFNNHLLFFNV